MTPIPGRRVSYALAYNTNVYCTLMRRLGVRCLGLHESVMLQIAHELD